MLADTPLSRSTKISVGQIKKSLEINNRPTLGIFAGTGWSGAIPNLKNEREMPFNEVMGLSTSKFSVEGHEKVIVAGEYHDKTVVILKGRTHLNEEPGNPKIFNDVRMETEILINLGIKKIISTSAVGSLPRLLHDGLFTDSLEVGSIVVIDGLVTLYAPQLPLWAGEFCNPEDALSVKLQNIALKALKKSNQPKLSGGHAMVLGPWFESRKYDKTILATSGASVVGMSLLPEAAIASLYDKVSVLGLCLVTNSPTEVHSHKINLARAHKQKEELQLFLKNLFNLLLK